MSVTFSWLKDNHKHLSDEEILSALYKYDKSFFDSWLLYNKLTNPSDKIDDYIIDLPATMIDDINSKI